MRGDAEAHIVGRQRARRLPEGRAPEAADLAAGAVVAFVADGVAHEARPLLGRGILPVIAVSMPMAEGEIAFLPRVIADPVREIDAAMRLEPCLRGGEERKEEAARLQHARDFRQGCRRIRDMLEHLVADHAVEALVGAGEAAVLDPEDARRDMRGNVGDPVRVIVLESVGAAHVELRRGLRRQGDDIAAAAAEIEHPAASRQETPRRGDDIVVIRRMGA